jgi:hypothetical protein
LSQPPLSGSSSQRPNFGLGLSWTTTGEAAPARGGATDGVRGGGGATEGDTTGGRGDPTRGGITPPGTGGAALGGAGAAGACGLIGPAARAGAAPRASRDSLTSLASLILAARATGDDAESARSDFRARLYGFRPPARSTEAALDEAPRAAPKRPSGSTKAHGASETKA